MLKSRLFIIRNQSSLLIFIRESSKKIYTRNKMALEEGKAYVWINNENLELQLMYKNSELNLIKHLKFNRKISDHLHQLLQRVSIKVTDIINVKDKRKDKSKNSTSSNNALTYVNVQLIENDESVVDSKLCNEIFFDRQSSTTQMYLKIADDVYTVLINLPIIRIITMPKYMMAGFLVYPKKVEGLFVNMNQCEYKWYRIIEKVTEDIFIGNGYCYIPNLHDIGHQLKLVVTPKYNGVVGLSSHMISSKTVEVGPGICNFETRQVFTPYTLSGKSFRVVTYNVLSSVYTDTDLGKAMFNSCPEYAISLSYRKLLLLKEISGYNADLICLQEVDESLFERDLSLILSYHNLEGIFLKKGGSVREGIAIFFRNARFRVLDNKEYALGTDLKNMDCLRNIWEVVTKHEAVAKRFTERTTVFQVIILQDKETGNILLLGNTHLYFHPNADHIRLLQAGMCIYIINDMIPKLKQDYPDKTVSVIFCGDFNSTPDSGIYQLFTKNKIPENHFVWSNNKDETIAGLSLSQPLHLDSACGTPEFTHYTSLFHACLDYIFYDKDSLQVEQVVPLPDASEILSYNGLPNAVFPSDHIALITDLKWK